MAVDPWSLYWQADNLESCIATKNIGDTENIAAFWFGFADQLADGANVLDLACGNGVVATHLLAHNSNLHVSGVDQAKISPTDFLKDSAVLDKVRFFPETEITQLPFIDESFAAITSQFGLEYAPVEDAGREAVRVLGSKGKIALLMHHAESEIVGPSHKQLEEMARLLEPGSLMDHLSQFIDGEIELQQLEAKGQDYLQAAGDKTRQLSGQIFEGINQVISLINANTAAARELANTMQVRLRADQQRLSQMSEASMNEAEFQSCVDFFAGLGIDIEVAETFVLQEEDQEVLIGWQLIGTKN